MTPKTLHELIANLTTFAESKKLTNEIAPIIEELNEERENSVVMLDRSIAMIQLLKDNDIAITKHLNYAKKLREEIVKDFIDDAYILLRDRIENPAGEFDDAGRFYAEYSELMDVRSPSRNWPFPQMIAGRSKKFIKKLVEKYEVKSYKELTVYAFA